MVCHVMPDGPDALVQALHLFYMMLDVVYPGGQQLVLEPFLLPGLDALVQAHRHYDCGHGHGVVK